MKKVFLFFLLVGLVSPLAQAGNSGVSRDEFLASTKATLEKFLGRLAKEDSAKLDPEKISIEEEKRFEPENPNSLQAASVPSSDVPIRTPQNIQQANVAEMQYNLQLSHKNAIHKAITDSSGN